MSKQAAHPTPAHTSLHPGFLSFSRPSANITPSTPPCSGSFFSLSHGNNYQRCCSFCHGNDKPWRSMSWTHSPSFRHNGCQSHHHHFTLASPFTFSLATLSRFTIPSVKHLDLTLQSNHHHICISLSNPFLCRFSVLTYLPPNPLSLLFQWAARWPNGQHCGLTAVRS